MVKIKQLLFTLVLLAVTQSASAMNKNILKATLAVPKCALAYGALRASTTVAHELGHAIPAQTFFGNVMGLQFFGEPKITFKNEKFFLGIGTNIFSFSGCLTQDKEVSTKAEKIKAMIVLASGPAAGVASALFSKKWLLKTSLNKKFVRFVSGFEIWSQLTNLIPYYVLAGKADPIFSGEIAETDSEVALSTDGFKFCNVYKAYKANTPCDMTGKTKK